MLTTHQDLTWHTSRICRVDLHLEVLQQSSPARCSLKTIVTHEADKWSTLRHTISNRDWESDLHQERLGLLVERCTSHNKDLHLASEGVDKLTLYN